jgi:hypothetical protein
MAEPPEHGAMMQEMPVEEAGTVPAFALILEIWTDGSIAYLFNC